MCVVGRHLLQPPSLQCVCQWQTSTHLQTSLHNAERHRYFGDLRRSAVDFSAGLTGICDVSFVSHFLKTDKGKHCKLLKSRIAFKYRKMAECKHEQHCDFAILN